jgi:isopentenyl diphosphate isomerase/L-lactate dehydrogenase-like FMN-dependent dehydrogenase
MAKIESRWRGCFSRRAALRSLAGMLAGSPLLRGQLDPFRDHSRVAGLNELLTAFDFEPAAFAHVPRDVYDFMMGSSDDESTFRRNRQAFDWVSLVPKGIADVSSIDTSTELFGQKMSFPILVAPTSAQGPLHPEGEMGMHKGAAAANTIMIVSSAATYTLDKIAAASPGPLWFQLYRLDTIEDTLERVGRAEAAGCKAVAMTVDGPFGPYRERVMHDRHIAGTSQSEGSSASSARARDGSRVNYGLGKGQVFDWKLVDTVKSATKVPFLLKGLQTAEDAKIALEHGVDGIIVSNHGARRVGHGTSTLEALPEVVDVVKGRIPVLIDSGFRRGSDVLKALAMGAKAVCLGRVPRWGLAGYGPAGAQRILEIVQAELVLAMANTGRPTLNSIDRSLVKVDFA